MSKTSSALQDLKKAVQNDDAVPGAKALRDLIAMEPTRWRELILIGGVLPDPSTKRCRSAIDALLRCATDPSLPSLPLEPLQDILSLAGDVVVCMEVFEDIRERLENSEALADPLKLVVRLCAFVESQVYIAEGKSLPQDGGSLDLDSLLRSTFETPNGGARVNVVAAVEELVETVELVLRYAQHRSTSVGPTASSLEGIISPYHDPDFEYLLILANAWRLHQELWALIKYLGWRSQPHPNGVLLFTPPDDEEFWRLEVGKVRTGRQQLEVLVPEQSRASMRAGDTPGRVLQIARTLSLPSSVHDTWNATVDIGILKQACSPSTYSILAESAIAKFHYGPALRELKFGGRSTVTAEVWLRVAGVLRVISSVIREAVRGSIEELDGHGCLSANIRTSLDALSRTVGEALGMGPLEAREAIDVFIFDATRKHLEIWDQPLIRLDASDVLIVPTLVMTSDPTRAIENILAQWGGDHGVRGKAFELEVADVFRHVTPHVATDVCFAASDREVEFDVAVWWQGYLVLAEAKCVKSIHGAADTYRARADILEAIDQLERRRRIVGDEWSKFRASAPKLSLPESAPELGRIVCIVVSNEAQFSTWEDRGIIVTDYRCLRRFFSDPSLRAVAVTESGVEVGEPLGVIHTESLSALGLRRYLAAPRQVRDVRERLRPGWLRLPRMSEQSPCIAVLTSEYGVTE